MRWVKIFGTGDRKVKDGGARFFSSDDLDKIAASYDPAHHEAPLAIPPVKDGSPAWGWVANLKRIGEYLYAQFKQVHPEFQSMIDAGKFSRQQISLFPDGRLRSVLFTGANPPDLPMLKTEFEEDFSGAAYEFCESDIENNPLFGTGSYSEDERIAHEIAGTGLCCEYSEEELTGMEIADFAGR